MQLIPKFVHKTLKKVGVRIPHKAPRRPMHRDVVNDQVARVLAARKAISVGNEEFTRVMDIEGAKRYAKEQKELAAIMPKRQMGEMGRERAAKATEGMKRLERLRARQKQFNLTDNSNPLLKGLRKKDVVRIISHSGNTNVEGELIDAGTGWVSLKVKGNEVPPYRLDRLKSITLIKRP